VLPIYLKKYAKTFYQKSKKKRSVAIKSSRKVDFFQEECSKTMPFDKTSQTEGGCCGVSQLHCANFWIWKGPHGEKVGKGIYAIGSSDNDNDSEDNKIPNDEDEDAWLLYIATCRR